MTALATVSASAKVNLWLRAGARGADGYHPIDTLFCALDLADEVGVRLRPEHTSPALRPAFAAPLSKLPDMGPSAANLAVRAATAFARRAGDGAGVEIRLTKRIPAGAGLGGGSSDAAAVLRTLARLYPGRLDRDELLGIAAELGSDVAFFASEWPLAAGTGRGERLRRLPPLPSRLVVLALPPFGVSTADAYAWLDRERTSAGSGEGPGIAASPGSAASPGLDPGPGLTWADVARRAVNHFEPALFQRHPLLRELRDGLRAGGAEIALVAGSGSAVFGVFIDEESAHAATSTLRRAFGDVRVLLTRTRPG